MQQNKQLLQQTSQDLVVSSGVGPLLYHLPLLPCCKLSSQQCCATVPLVSQGPDWPQTPQQRTEEAVALHSSPQTEFTLLVLLLTPLWSSRSFMAAQRPWCDPAASGSCTLCNFRASCNPPPLSFSRSILACPFPEPWVCQCRFTPFCKQSQDHCAHDLLCSHPACSDQLVAHPWQCRHSLEKC